MYLYATTIFLSAFLLFQVQPLIAKSILPWFGGAAGVWTTCMLFFQVVLLLGYLYAHLLTSRLTPKRQAGLHMALLFLSLLSLPILPKEMFKPVTPGEPTLRILLTLLVTVGLPYFLLSTTGSLLQAWYSLRQKAQGVTTAYPYRLYALSNLGSVLGLVTYPFLIEPNLTVKTQAYVWSGSYTLFILCGTLLAVRIAKLGNTVPTVEQVEDAQREEEATQPPTLQNYLYWVLLAMTGSSLLLAVSNHMSQNVAAIPFLWVLPLSLYLLSFILCFGSTEWEWRASFRPMPMIGIALLAVGTLSTNKNIDIKILLPIFSFGLFVVCVLCHGELSRLKPSAKYLTAFYLTLSIGGALGGLFVGIIAPHLFPDYYELPITIIVAALIAAFSLYRDNDEELGFPFYYEPYWIILVGAIAIMAIFFGSNISHINHLNRQTVRNFYGTLYVRDVDTYNKEYARRQLIHGTILHGEQFLDPKMKGKPISYYSATSGAARILREAQSLGTPLRVGVIGLGTGTLASFGRKGDDYHIYEINPLVLHLAQTEFTYLKDSPATVSVHLGDARLVLEYQPSQQFDVILVDAFSSDAIPIHLLTKEALELYFRHLKPTGVLGVHISNRYLDLRPVVKAGGDAIGKEVREIKDNPAGISLSATTWMAVTGRKEVFQHKDFQDKESIFKVKLPPHFRLWTDDFSNLYQIMN